MMYRLGRIPPTGAEGRHYADINDDQPEVVHTSTFVPSAGRSNQRLASGRTVMTPEALRVAFVTQWFPPEPVDQPLWIAESLRRHGQRLAILTGMPHFPLGQLAPGYSASTARRETHYGFPVQRCPEYPDHGLSSLGRVANYSSFALSASWWGRSMLSTADVSLVYSSPATAALPAMTAKALHGTPYVLLVQDLWPDTVFATGFLVQGPARGAAEVGLTAFTRASYRGAAHIAVIAPGMRTRLIERGVPESRITLHYNWTDESVTRPTRPNGRLRSELGIGDESVVIAYAGNHGRAQALEAWVAAIAQLPAHSDVHLVLIGEGTERESLASNIRSQGDKRVHMLPTVPSYDVADLLADADAMVISLADDPLFDVTLPSKTQSTLAMGKPILASGRGDLAQVVQDSSAGFVAAPEDSSAIATVVARAETIGRDGLARLGQHGRAFYQKNMSEAVGGKRLAEILRRAAGGRHGERAR